MTVNYRESYGMFCVNGILFNHESPAPRRDLRHPQDHPRARAHQAAACREKLYLGNLDAKRDWGYAPDYVEAMWRMLQPHEPDDYVIATGESHSVREFLERAFAMLGLDWRGARRDRPALLPPGRGRRAARRREQGARALGWKPRSSFEELVRIMVEADLKLLDDELAGRTVRAIERARRTAALGRAAGRRHRRRRLPRHRVVRLLEERGRRGAGDPLSRARPARRGRRAARRSTGAEIVFHLAARVGGIGFNRRNPGAARLRQPR